MEPPPTARITTFTPRTLRIEVALHRRSNAFFIVLPRAYGMGTGYKHVAQLNWPQPNEPSPDPPASEPHLHPRIWLRTGGRTSFDGDNGRTWMTLDVLLDPSLGLMKDTGLRRRVKVDGKDGWERVKESRRKMGGGKEEKRGGDEEEEHDEEDIEECLVEILIHQDSYCHRCAWCGVWEYSYDYEVRSRKAGLGNDGRPWYWCGHCSKRPNPLDWRRWFDPEKLSERVYFQQP